MKIIESIKNDWVKHIKKLEQKKHRDQQKRYLIEGEHLVEEAINFNASMECLIVTEESQETYDDLVSQVDAEIIVQVTEDIMKHLSSLPSPQPIMAVVAKNTNKVDLSSAGKVLLLDNVQDPGNVGTMIRTADAAGFDCVILGEGTADIYNSKVVRSMQGSQFHIQVEEVPILVKINELKEQNFELYGTELNEKAISYCSINKESKLGIIFGNEGQGVSREILAETDYNVYIPMKGQAESLNVAIAAGIIMFSI
ncbi:MULTISPECIES: RNA methyltransferase [Vagococcus]|uniref:rRNA methylase n=1 Tax=Vagococcus fluvialis bH819 TaxID=1255619 RepID=A0A1X6WR80_9ENTE|nr:MULTISPECIES: RNA methyltransferase [Vagococcus]SLM86800.1 rRNA methylase [Vagococcus fluvialis bH819]HCM88741.1 RNA methyltransferase [Vagococcus sp.]